MKTFVNNHCAGHFKISALHCMYVGMLFLREIVGKKVKKEKTPWENYLQKNDALRSHIQPMVIYPAGGGAGIQSQVVTKYV